MVPKFLVSLKISRVIKYCCSAFRVNYLEAQFDNCMYMIPGTIFAALALHWQESLALMVGAEQKATNFQMRCSECSIAI